MEKAPDAFRTITEVSEWLDTPSYVLRFWESRFPQITPVKRAGGRRYYRPEDMLLLGGIKKLLHIDGKSIKSVQQLIRDQGIDHVADLSPGLHAKFVEQLGEGGMDLQAELQQLDILNADMQKAKAEAEAASKDSPKADAKKPAGKVLSVKVVPKSQVAAAAASAKPQEAAVSNEAPKQEPKAAPSDAPESATPDAPAPVPSAEDRQSARVGVMHSGPRLVQSADRYSADQLAEIETLFYSLKMVRNNMRRAARRAG